MNFLVQASLISQFPKPPFPSLAQLVSFGCGVYTLHDQDSQDFLLGSWFGSAILRFEGRRNVSAQERRSEVALSRYITGTKKVFDLALQARVVSELVLACEPVKRERFQDLTRGITKGKLLMQFSSQQSSVFPDIDGSDGREFPGSREESSVAP